MRFLGRAAGRAIHQQPRNEYARSLVRRPRPRERTASRLQEDTRLKWRQQGLWQRFATNWANVFTIPPHLLSDRVRLLRRYGNSTLQVTRCHGLWNPPMTGISTVFCRLPLSRWVLPESEPSSGLPPDRELSLATRRRSGWVSASSQARTERRSRFSQRLVESGIGARMAQFVANRCHTRPTPGETENGPRGGLAPERSGSGKVTLPVAPLRQQLQRRQSATGRHATPRLLARTHACQRGRDRMEEGAKAAIDRSRNGSTGSAKVAHFLTAADTK